MSTCPPAAAVPSLNDGEIAPAWVSTASELSRHLEELEREDDEEVLAPPPRPKAPMASERLYGQRQPQATSSQPQQSSPPGPKNHIPPPQMAATRQPRRMQEVAPPAYTPRYRALAPRDHDLRSSPAAQASLGLVSSLEPTAAAHAQRKAAVSPEFRSVGWQPPTRASGVLSAARSSPAPGAWSGLEPRHCHGGSGGDVDDDDGGAGGGGIGGSGFCVGSGRGGGDPSFDGCSKAPRIRDHIIELATRTAHKSFVPARSPARSLSPTRPISTSACARSFPAGFRPLQGHESGAYSAREAKVGPRHRLRVAQTAICEPEGGTAQGLAFATRDRQPPLLAGTGSRPASAWAGHVHEDGTHGGCPSMDASDGPRPASANLITSAPGGPTTAPPSAAPQMHELVNELVHELGHLERRDLRYIGVARVAIRQLDSERRVIISRPQPRPESARTVPSRHERPPPAPSMLSPTTAKAGRGAASQQGQRRAPRLVELQTRALRKARNVRLGTAITTMNGPVLGIFSTGPGTYLGDVLPSR